MMKTGKNKRLLASILAASMLLAMSPFALADGTEDTTNQTGQEQSQGQPVEGGGTEQTCAAKIGETEYSTLAGAIYDANSDVTIVMLRDVTENIEINKSLTLDLGGFKLSGDADAAVVTISGDKPQVTVENGTVTGGRNPQNGGGFAIDSAVVRLEDLTITGNEAVGGNGNGEVGGGGIYASHADVSMRNVTVSENSVTGKASDGGGILVRYGSLTMNGCHVEGNAAPDCGGGMLLRHSVLNVTKSFFENNTAKYGAGIYFGDTPNEAEKGCSGEHNHLITDSTISGNKVSDSKNGIGGGMYVGTTSNLTLRNSKLLNNDGASQGGAIYAYNAANINIAKNSAVYNNTAKTAGDDLLFNGATFTLPNAKDMSGDRILSSNKAEITGWYHDGWFKWNAAAQDGKGGYEEIGRWTVETADEYTPVENDSHAISLKAATKNSSGGGTDPIEWNVTRSKTATALDTSTWTSNVTLSLPSAEEALASDVVFVLDKSMSAEWEGQALEMLAALKEQAASTKAKVKVGVVIFNKQANKTAPLTDLATGYDDIQAAIEQTISSGTNTHAGLLAGKQMLDEDTEVAANRKYLIFVSDGITYMYNAEPTVIAWSFFADAWKHWANPENWNSKYGSNNPPDDWSAWMTKIGAQVEAQGTEYEYPYEPTGTTATKWTPEDATYKNYANSIDKALYLTYQVYQEAKTEGYNCYAVAKESSNNYHWGPAFMDYLANGETVDFGKIQNDILYAVSAGSTVTDTIGEKFTFGGVDSFTLKVGTKEIKGVKDASDENTVNFGEKKKDGKYPYTVTYTPATKTFVWTINENVSNFAPVQLTYTVKLTTPETAPGTYGVEDLKGEKNVPSDKALFTNKCAVLKAINSAGAMLNPLDFPKPSVSYTVKKSSSGGGGGGGRKPTVTIPDDVPTGLNGDDHYAYIVGYPNGNVEPNGNITRAEVATIFFRLLTEKVRTANSTQSNSLSDVTRGQWFNHAVSTLSSMGIVKGHNDGTFAPNAPITRAEFAAIAARFDDKNRDTSSKFTDIASHWAKNEIGIAANKGWINGYPDGTFRPNQYITRAEAMTLVNRVLNRLPENSSDLLDSMIKWPDNSDASAWYYLAVQEATNSHYYKTKENKFEKWTELRKTRDWTELEK